MPDRRDWLKKGALLAFFSAALCCAVLGIQLLIRHDNTKAGVATLLFNFTVHLPNSLVKPRAIPTVSLFQPLQSEVQNAAGFLTSDIPAAVSSVQSAAVAAESAAIQALLPRNISLGTTQFCVGFSNSTPCHHLPLNISNIVPKDVTRFVGDQIQSLHPLEGILAKVGPASIEAPLILGLILLFVMACIFIYFLKVISLATRLLRVGICLFFLLFCIAFIVPAAVLYDVHSKIQSIGPVVGIEKGVVSKQVIGASICAIFMAALTIIISIFM